MSPQNLVTTIALIATVTLSLIVVAMVSTMLAGLFDDRINNEKIRAAMTPAFQSIIGGFIGLIAGIHIGGKDGK